MNETASEALGSYVLSMNLIFILQQKKILTEAEAADAVDKAVLNLEMHQHQAGPERQQDFEGARKLLESLRDVISED